MESLDNTNSKNPYALGASYSSLSNKPPPAITDDLKDWDRACDYVPCLSTINNLTDLVLKVIIHVKKEPQVKTRYWKHLKDKTVGRCLIGSIPLLGNAILGIYDQVKFERKYAAMEQLREGLEKEDQAAVKSFQEDNEKQKKFLTIDSRYEYPRRGDLNREKGLKYAENQLQKDIIRSDAENFKYASNEIKNDIEFIKELLEIRTDLSKVDVYYKPRYQEREQRLKNEIILNTSPEIREKLFENKEYRVYFHDCLSRLPINEQVKFISEDRGLEPYASKDAQSKFKTVNEAPLEKMVKEQAQKIIELEKEIRELKEQNKPL